jgi:sugar/nucleoside kinase (ribokinase family)
MDVICVGILVADIFSSPLESVPNPGELQLAEKFVLNAGGCAVNTAACLRKQGREVRVLGKVGEDLLGEFVARDLGRLGIDSANLRRSPTHPTSTSFILNVRGEDRRFIHVLGANADFSYADVDLAALGDAKILYVGGYLGMPALGPDGLARLFQEAKHRSLTTVLDVIVPVAKPASLAALEQVLPYTDFFLPNEDEARLLTGYADPLKQARCLAKSNDLCTMVITRGAKGLVVKRGPGVWRVGAFPVDFVDGTGAGDAFAAGLMVGLLEKWPLEKTLRFASAVGASCVRALGCTAGVFHFDEALAYVQSTPVEITRE